MVPIQAYDLLKTEQKVSIFYFVVGSVAMCATLCAPILFQRLPRFDELQMARDFRRAVQGEVKDGPDSVASDNQGGRKNMRQPQRRRQDGKFGAIQNEGQLVSRAPLSPWEAYAQALLFSNELAYVN